MIRIQNLTNIRGRIVLIYCLLVFIATTIIGVFILSQTEAYYIDSTKRQLTQAVRKGSLLVSLNSYDALQEHEQEIRESINAWSKTLQQEIFVVGEDFTIIAASNESRGSAVGRLDYEVILQALSGEVAESMGTIEAGNTGIPVMNMAFPIENNKDVKGVLYLRADLSSVYDSVDQSKEIFVKAMFIGLAITVALGFFIARSITEPINEVTSLAEKMARGDFSTGVHIKSNDEIGRLAEMFNLLRQRLDETLSEISNEKSKLETILQHMADGLIAVDLSGKIIHANPAARAMLRAGNEEIEAQSYDELMKPVNPNLAFDRIVERCRLVPSEEIFEYEGFAYAVRYDHFRDENGEDVGVILIFQDITQRQKLEKMQMDFVANVSHELKTPLTTIKSYTETLLDGALEEKEVAGSFLEIIDTEADRMNRLVKDLLQLSRQDGQQPAQNKKEHDLIQIVRSAVRKVELTAAEKKHHLNCLFEEDPVKILADKDRIEQVVLNLLSNAIKYTREGGRIDIDVFRSRRQVIMTVEDNGIGIPSSELSRVFERFFRVDKARSRAMGGTGLGLAISKQIVEEHGGSIRLQSREGKGTVVKVMFPAVAARGERNID